MLTYIALFTALTLLFLFYLVPRFETQYRQMHDRAMQAAAQVEASYLQRLLDDRINSLRALAQSPVIVNSVMLADANNFELLGLLEDFRLVGDPTRVLIQDLDGGVIYRSRPQMAAVDYANNQWVKDLQAQKTSSHFQLLQIQDGYFNFLLAIPVVYDEHVEGLLFAYVAAPVAKLFRQPSEGDFQLVVSQGDVSATLYNASVAAPHSIRLVIDPYNVALTYTGSRLVEQRFLAQMKYTGLVVLFSLLVFSLLMAIAYGRRRLPGGAGVHTPEYFSELPSAKYSLGSYLLPLLIFAFGLLTSIVGHRIISELGQKNIRNEAIAVAKRQAQRIEDGIDSNISVLRAMKSYYNSAPSVSREDFKHFVTPFIKHKPDIQALEWIPVVPHKLRRQYEDKARADGHDRFRFWEERDGSRVAAAKRDVYYPVYFIEPLQGNKLALGYDLGSNAARLQAMSRAVENRANVATARIKLIQNDEKQVGFIILAPVFHAAGNGEEEHIKGFVLMLQRIDELVATSLQDSGDRVAFSIYDVTDSEQGELLYQAENLRSADPATPLYSKAFDIGGRRWLMSFSQPFKPAAQPDWIARLALALGAVFSLFAALYILQLTRKSQQVERLVVLRTQEIQELTSAMENAVEGVSRLDAGGSYSYVNESYAALCGYPPEQLIGQNWLLTVHDEDQETLRGAYQTMLQHGRISCEARSVRKDGGQLHTALTMVACYDHTENFIGHYCFMSDITARKTAEEELLNSNIELERFAYIASHDLQEPLRMVSSFAELLRDEYAETFDETARMYFRYIIEGAHRMRDMVEDLLAYAKVEHSGVEFSLTDTQHEFEVVLNNIGEMIDEAQASVTNDPLPTVYASPVWINRVLQNLITNAVKYASSERTAAIHVACRERADDWLFSVSDNGIGIKPDYLQQIFVIFKRLHNSRDCQGTGIGLAICHKVVSALGGNIWVESTFGEGSVFYFTVPKSQGMGAQADAA